MTQAGLDRSYLVRIRIGFGILLVSYLAGTMTLFLGCRPFHKYWQINPNPGSRCNILQRLAHAIMAQV